VRLISEPTTLVGIFLVWAGRNHGGFEIHMKTFATTEEKLLFALAIFGLVVPNGLFIYYFLFFPAVLWASFSNPIALVFMIEAFVLMILFGWLIHYHDYRSPGWLAFIVMSLIGSMAFSVPFFLYLTSRRARNAQKNYGPAEESLEPTRSGHVGDLEKAQL
jgi:hypothetical protein